VGRAYDAPLHEVLGALGRRGFALPPRDVVKPINWPRAFDPAGGFERPVVMTGAIVSDAQVWDRIR
jgi:hypothetical protein